MCMYPKSILVFDRRDTMRAIYKMTVTTANQLSFLRMRDWLSGCVPRLLFSTQRMLLCAHSRALLYISNILRRMHTPREPVERHKCVWYYTRRIFPSVLHARVSCENGRDALANNAWERGRMREKCQAERQAGGIMEVPAYYLGRVERAHFNNQMLLLASMVGIMIRLRISFCKHAEKLTLMPV